MAKGKLRHPPGLYVLASTEAAERFSFYTMRYLLVLYLTLALSYERSDALELNGTYLLLLYFSALVGGHIADRVLGARKAIFIGGIVMCLGQFTLMVPEFLFYGMGLLIAGNGLFKPNISSIVSGLYDPQDKRRDGAFTIFYMGINLGAFLAIFSSGLGEMVSWWLAFGIAGTAMIVSLSIFHFFQGTLGTAGFPAGREVTPDSRLERRDWRDIAVWAGSLAVLVVALVGAWGFVGPYWKDLHWSLKVGVGLVLIAGAGFGLWGRKGTEERVPLTKEEWQRVASIVILSVFVIFFWAGFEQASGTMTLFAKEQTDRHIFGWEMPATWLQGFNPVFIILLAVPFSMLWDWNDRRRRGLSTPSKMGLGMIVLGLGFVVMYFGQQVADAEGQAGMSWLVLVYLLHTIGEICLSPLGLSMVTKLSPTRVVSLMMGVWFTCTGMAYYLSGRLEEICQNLGIGLWVTLIVTSMGIGVLLLLLTPLLRRWMHGRA